ncbi:tetraacyldisaccharide 4'-kinase [Colwelliaceae bacterium 6441]
MRLIEKVWFEGHQAKWWLVPLLLPLSLLFWCLSALRRFFFNVGIKSSIQVNCPIVIVGNIGVGGNGKTPVVLWLVKTLLQQGIKVGVISRGYGGHAPHYPYLLTKESTALEAGDEPVLIYQRCDIPVAVGADRIAAANKLIEQGCQLIISDDGLQHYRLKRDYELLVVDGKRYFGNGLLLPAGPLRETKQRLNQVNQIIINGADEETVNSHIYSQTPIHNLMLKAEQVINLKTGEAKTLAEFIDQHSCINAIAGIGSPQRFFNYLNELGFIIEKQQGFIDHQAYNEHLFSQIDSNDNPSANHALVMTEKDAVKCKGFAKEHWWYLPVDAVFSSKESETIITEIVQLINQQTKT